MSKIVPVASAKMTLDGTASTYDIDTVNIDINQDVYTYTPLGQGAHPVETKVLGGPVRITGSVEGFLDTTNLGAGPDYADATAALPGDYLVAPFKTRRESTPGVELDDGLVTMIWTLLTGYTVTFDAAISNVNFTLGNDNMARWTAQFESSGDLTYVRPDPTP